MEVQGIKTGGAVCEGVEGVDGFDEVGLEGAGDLGVFDLLEDVKP